VAAIGVLVVLAAWAFVKLQPTLPRLALPATPASAPAGPLDGRWEIAPGSVAGFRVRETALGMGNDVAGRTGSVTGALVVSGGQVTSAAFRVDLTAVTAGGKPQPQFARSLDVRQHPDATFTLAHPVTLGAAFASGATIHVTATGQFAMNGVSRLVTVTMSGRRDGTALQVTGSIPVAFPAWNISGPAGLGLLGSLAGHGEAEFLLILRQP
jgi:polyisoprenoid-binding protein YceI